MKLTKHFTLPILILAITGLLMGCSNKPVYEKTLTLKNAVWQRFDIKTFEVEIEKVPAQYEFEAIVNCNDSFQYKSLPFYVILTTPSGEERMREVSFQVREGDKLTKNKETGKAEARIQLWYNVNITEKGKCKLTFENMIPKYETGGIETLSLLVKQADKK